MKTEQIKLQWQEHNRDNGMTWNEIAELVNQVSANTTEGMSEEDKAHWVKLFKTFKKDRLIEDLVEARGLLQQMTKIANDLMTSNNQQTEVKECESCKFFKGESYHDKMYCRDCRQGDRFEPQKADSEQTKK